MAPKAGALGEAHLAWNGRSPCQEVQQLGERVFFSAEITLLIPEKTRKAMGNYLKQWLNQSVAIQRIEVH